MPESLVRIIIAALRSYAAQTETPIDDYIVGLIEQYLAGDPAAVPAELIAALESLPSDQA
jgi:hypothetical protein